MSFKLIFFDVALLFPAFPTVPREHRAETVTESGPTVYRPWKEQQNANEVL